MLGRALLIASAVALGTACASTRAVPRPFPTPGAGHPPETAVAPATSAPDGYAVSGSAMTLQGAPYRDGGSDPGGFDCSGLVQYVYGLHAVPLPRTVTDQYAAGRPVEPDEIQPGDLLFFSTIAPGASHVGIAIGGDEFVHAPSSSGEVRVEHLSSAYWSARLVGVRRIL